MLRFWIFSLILAVFFVSLSLPEGTFVVDQIGERWVRLEYLGDEQPGNLVNLPKKAFPNVREGDVVELSLSGITRQVRADREHTQQRQEKIGQLLNTLTAD